MNLKKTITTTLITGALLFSAFTPAFAMGTIYTTCNWGQDCTAGVNAGHGEFVSVTAHHETFNPYTNQTTYWTENSGVYGCDFGSCNRYAFFSVRSAYGPQYDHIYAFTGSDPWNDAYFFYAGP